MGFPEHRLRRMRAHPRLRAMVAETSLTADHLIQPLFVRPGEKQKTPIASMPDIYSVGVFALSSL